jgi:hypothetical protein
VPFIANLLSDKIIPSPQDVLCDNVHKERVFTSSGRFPASRGGEIPTCGPPLEDGSAMDVDPYHDGRVEQDPADAGKVDRLVVLLKPIDEPQACGEEIRGPRNERDTAAVRPTQMVSTFGRQAARKGLSATGRGRSVR